MAPSYRRLQQYAVAISIVSIIYSAAEGGVSVGLGSESSSRSLVFFGVQSGIEVISACIVLWRFWKVAKPGEERDVELSQRELRIEKIASASIGILLILLGLGAEVAASVALALHQEPDTSNASLIISASCFVFMVLLWLPKRYLARALDSSAMKGEATCSLSCIQITVVLFIGSLVHRLSKRSWWIDSATTLVLGLLFAWEGYKMIKWVRDPNFNGGCCQSCKPHGNSDIAELGESYRDLCDCCEEKCKDAGHCICEESSDEERECCQPINVDGSKCCTFKIVQGTRLDRPRRMLDGNLEVDRYVGGPGSRKSAEDDCCANGSSCGGAAQETFSSPKLVLPPPTTRPSACCTHPPEDMPHRMTKCQNEASSCCSEEHVTDIVDAI